MSVIHRPNSTALEKRLRQLDLHRADDARPKYERLRSFIANEVDEGALRGGTLLPSEQQLSEILRVARGTVRQALAELEEEGVVQRRQGAGTFVVDMAKPTRQVDLDVFALVVPGADTGFWLSLLAGFENKTTGFNKQTLTCSTENDLGKQADIFIRLIQKRVAGVALSPSSLPQTPAYQVKHLQDHGIPVVLCHRTVEGIDAPALAIPFRDVGHMAGRKLVENGHRRVAFFSMDPPNEISSMYVEGLREVIEAAGGELSDSLIYWGETVSPNANIQNASVLKRLQAMFNGSNPPTAIMASFDPLAERIFLMLGEMGLRVPEDVSVISVGATDRKGALTERLTSVTVDEVDLGRRAAALLQEMCTGQRPLDDAEKVYVPLWVSEGTTVGPVNGKKS